jgi:hypothetical protein
MNTSNQTSHGVDENRWLEITARMLSYSVLLVGIASFCATAFVSIRAYSPAWVNDEWVIGVDLMTGRGHYSLHQLWHQHNEHRIPILKALCLADLHFFGNRNVLLFATSWVVQILELLASIYFLRRLGDLSANAFRTLVGVAMLCELNFNQLENFTWAFQVSFFMASMFAILSVGLLCCYAQKRGQGRSSSALIVSCLVSAFLAECSLASGLTVWIVLPICGSALRLPRRIIIFILGGTGLAAIALYLVGYSSPKHLGNPFVTVLHPLLLIQYMLVYFGTSWQSFSVTAGLWLSGLAIAYALFLWLRILIRDQRREYLLVFSLSVVMLSVFTSLMTALGRVTLGLAQAGASRYQTPAMLFWGFLALSVLAGVGSFSHYQRMSLVGIQLLCIIFFISQIRLYPAVLEHYDQLTFAIDEGTLALDAGFAGRPIMCAVFPDTTAVVSWYGWLRQAGLLKPFFPEYALVGSQLERDFKVENSAGCSGYFDSAELEPGRATLPSYIDPKTRILLTTNENRIVGLAVTGYSGSQDSTDGNFSGRHRHLRWRGYAVVNNDTKLLRAFKVLPGGQHVCRLGGEVQLLHSPR